MPRPTSTISRLVVCTSALALLTAAACNGDDDENDVTPPPAAQAPADQAHDTAIAAFAFESLTIAVGDTVRWTNEDNVPHTVTEVDGAWDSGSFGQGATFERQFDEAGSFDFFCAIHPGMTGTITAQ